MNKTDEQPNLPDNTINELLADILPVDLLQIVDTNTLSTPKKSGNYDQVKSQLKNLTTNREQKLTKYNKITNEYKATQHTNPMEDYPELETTIANLTKEQNSKPAIRKVIKLLETESAPTKNICSTEEEQKYLKQFRRLFTECGILYKRYSVQDGKLCKQLRVQKTTQKEVMYKIHNAPTGGHL